MPRSTLWPRRRPRQPSRFERALGLTLILVLAGVVGLFVLSGTREGPPSLRMTEAGAPPPPAADDGPFPLLSPAGWPRGETTSYDESTLFEKINGKADAYLAYGFGDLLFTSYADAENPEVFVDVYLYRMSAPLDGYGIYRAQRSGSEAAIDLGEEGAVAGGAVFARMGRHYLEVVASGPESITESRAIARAIVGELEAPADPVVLPRGLPTEGRTVVRFDRRSALGVEFLRDAFVALYEDGVRVVLARAEHEEAAREARTEAEATFELFGESATFETVGRHVLGVVGSEDEARARDILQALKVGLEDEE